MIKEKEHLVLDNIRTKDVFDKTCNLATENGLEIFIKNIDNTINEVALILPEADKNNCYIKTIGTKFQDCIISWDLFKEFVELVDEAYYRVQMAINCTELDKYMK